MQFLMTNGLRGVGIGLAATLIALWSPLASIVTWVVLLLGALAFFLGRALRGGNRLWRQSGPERGRRHRLYDRKPAEFSCGAE